MISDLGPTRGEARGRPRAAARECTPLQGANERTIQVTRSGQTLAFSLLFRSGRGGSRGQSQAAEPLLVSTGEVSIPFPPEAGSPWYVDCSKIQLATKADEKDRVAQSIAANGEEGI